MDKRLLNLLVGLTAFCSSALAINTLGNYVNPVINGYFPDPTVMRAQDGAFYTACTAGLTPVYKSYNLCDWTHVGNCFTEETKPSYGHIGIWGDTWAPDLNYINGKYVMYYSIGEGGKLWECGIGVAWSENPAGPYHDAKRLFNSQEINVINSIDPCYYEDNGKKYLFWGSFYGIYAIELSDDGLSIKSGAKPVAIADTNYEDRNNGIEGTMIHKRGKYYYLIGSQGWCCGEEKSTYKLRVARSTNVLGPYYDKNGKAALDHCLTQFLVSNSAVAGPGHCSEIITDDDGIDWILYHGYQIGDTKVGRKMYLDKINWSSDGWPTVYDGTPSSVEIMKPYFRSACANMREKWNFSEKRNTKTQKGWDASNVRNFAYNDGKLYCVYGGGSAIKVINAQTGEDLGNLNEGNICGGGLLKFADVKVFNGHILACNLAAPGSEFRIYCWDGDNQLPYILMSTTVTNEVTRLGDCMEIAPPSDWYNELWFCFANQNGSTTNIIEFCRDAAGWTKYVYPVTSDGKTQFRPGALARAYPIKGTWWIDGTTCKPSYFGRTNGILIRQLDVNISPYWGASHHEFKFRGQKIAANLIFDPGVSGDDNSTFKGCRMRLINDRVGKYSKVYSVGEFPSDGLGSNTRNTNATGDIAINTDGENYVEAWVFSTTHGMAHYVFGNPPAKNPSKIPSKSAPAGAPELYFCGTNYDNWNHVAQYRMSGSNGVYTVHVPFIDGEFKILNSDNSEEWSYPRGVGAKTKMSLNTTYYVSNNIGGGKNGSNNCQLANPAMDCTVVYDRNKNTIKITGISVPGIYLAHSLFTGWSPCEEAYRFSHKGNGIYALHLDQLPANEWFKVTTGGWKEEGCAAFSVNRGDLELGVLYSCPRNDTGGEDMAPLTTYDNVSILFDASAYKLMLVSGEYSSVSTLNAVPYARQTGVFDLTGRRVAADLKSLGDRRGVFIVVTESNVYKLIK